MMAGLAGFLRGEAAQSGNVVALGAGA